MSKNLKAGDEVYTLGADRARLTGRVVSVAGHRVTLCAYPYVEYTVDASQVFKCKPVMCQRAARLVLWRLIKSAKAAGYIFSLSDGECWTVLKSEDTRAVMAAAMTTDEDVVRFRNRGNEVIGSVWLVYGNSGWDVICDYTANERMEALIAPIMDWAEKMEARIAG